VSGAKSDWWIHGVPPLAALHLMLFLALRARPGRLAITLWRWGPPALVTGTAIVLVIALASALRDKLTWTWRRAAGLGGLCTMVATMGVYQTFPSSHDRTPSAVDFQIPLDGAVTVAWGGATPRENYHVVSPAERWGYDLLYTVEGRSHRGAGRNLADFYAYDRPVYVPASGRVVAVRDGIADAAPGRPDPQNAGGNRIVIEVAPAEYLVVAHLRAGSIRTAAGELVRQGEPIARIGNSGNSSEPHLHLHLQDTPATDDGEGIPFYFSRYVVAGSGETLERGMPRGGVRRGRFVGETVQSLPGGS
jgi:murein DD-endopeptidase MepM/ murein hydrolase activator NlpD